MCDFPPILTVGQAAQMMQVGKDKMWGWIHGGRLPCIKDGRIYRINRDKLLELAASGELMGEPLPKAPVQKRRKKGGVRP